MSRPAWMAEFLAATRCERHENRKTDRQSHRQRLCLHDVPRQLSWWKSVVAQEVFLLSAAATSHKVY
jgi:hypothetical protein